MSVGPVRGGDEKLDCDECRSGCRTGSVLGAFGVLGAGLEFVAVSS